MSRRPRHEQIDDEYLDHGCVKLRCRCGWVSPPVARPNLRMAEDEWDRVTAVCQAAWDEHYAPLVTPSPSQLFDLRRDRWGGWHHHLAGEAVHAGAPLELLLPGGIWWSGRYESAWPPGWTDAGPTAMFYAPSAAPGSTTVPTPSSRRPCPYPKTPSCAGPTVRAPDDRAVPRACRRTPVRRRGPLQPH